jgi:hypothetical protein
MFEQVIVLLHHAAQVDFQKYAGKKDDLTSGVT